MGSVSYKEALTPAQQVVMRKFLRDLAGIHRMARERGLERFNVARFIDAYRPKMPGKNNLIDKREREKAWRERRKRGEVHA